MTYLKKRLGRRIVWFVCDFHAGELDEAAQLEINAKFTRLNVCPPISMLPEKVVKNLSNINPMLIILLKQKKSQPAPQSKALSEMNPVS